MYTGKICTVNSRLEGAIFLKNKTHVQRIFSFGGLFFYLTSNQIGENGRKILYGEDRARVDSTTTLMCGQDYVHKIIYK